MSTNQELIFQDLTESAQMLLHFGYKQVKIIAQIAEEIIRVYQRQGKVIFCGNGGSAAQAEHLCAELVGRFKLNRPSLPALALTVNPALTTAIANDLGYEEVFARQIESLVQAGDLVIFLSTSGSSPNIIKGVEAAKAKKALTVGWTGANGEELRNLADLALTVPSSDTPRIQEAHLTAGHIICSLVELTLFGGSGV